MGARPSDGASPVALRAVRLSITTSSMHPAISLLGDILMIKPFQAIKLTALYALVSVISAADTIIFSEVQVVKPNATIEFVVNPDREISTFHKTELKINNKSGEVVFQYEDDVLYIKRGILQFPAQFAENVKRYHQVGVAQNIKRGQRYLVFRSAAADMEYSVSILIK